MTRPWQEALFRLWPVRWVLGWLFLLRGACYSALGRRFRALNDFCWVLRVTNVAGPRSIARTRVYRAIADARSSATNDVVEAYLADPASKRLANSFALGGGGPHDLFRDLIVLKAATDDEKGVILLKYARTFSAVVALLDMRRLQERYDFVLEPCWSGYIDPAILMYVSPKNPVVVQCFTEDDYRFIESIGAPMVPIRLGPADWVDSSIFRAPPVVREKIYDLVMVANWARHKRHAQLFRALKSIRDRDVRVLLVGFGWGGRTADDIRAEAASMRNERITVEIKEKLPQPELARYLSQCKVFVFLSRKEGDNKAVVEAMFADVPAIVYARSIGGARSRINPATGVLAEDEELAQKVRAMLDDYRKFTPRAWALENTGSAAATRVLDATLANAARAGGAPWTRSIVEKTNAPNLGYKQPEQRASFAADYDFVTSCLLKTRS